MPEWMKGYKVTDRARIAEVPLSNRKGFILILALLPLAACTNPDPNVATQHNNNFRTGAFLSETALTPTSVRNQGMHLMHGHLLNGAILTQPLYVSDVQFRVPFATVRSPGVFVGTQTNHLYGLLAGTLQPVWDVELKDLNTDRPYPRGINATPVIDLANERIFVLFSTMWLSGDPSNCSTDQCRALVDEFSSSHAAYWLVAIDLRDGHELDRVQVEPSISTGESNLTFNPLGQLDHPGLLLDHGYVYVAFGADAGLEGQVPYHGWLVRYRADHLSDQRGVFCTSPKPSSVGPSCPPYAPTYASSQSLGAGIWQGGGGLVADPVGNVYFLTGNGRADFAPRLTLTPGRPISSGLYGDSIVKLEPSGSGFHPSAYAPPEADCLEKNDADLGSGGAMIIPGTNLVIGGGKSGFMYVLNRSTMQLLERFTASTNQYDFSLRDQSWDAGPHLHGSPTYWRSADPTFGNLYIWGEKDYLKLYRFDTSTQVFEAQKRGRLSLVVPYKQAQVLALADTMPGGMISLSANENRQGSGIVWATLPDTDCPPGKFCPKPPEGPFGGQVYAFDAETLELLWHSHFGTIAHWVPPTIADGRVYIATADGNLLDFELGNGGSDRVGEPTPGKEPCTGCHSESQARDLLAHLPALHVRFPDEADVSAFATMNLKLLAPNKPGLTQDLVLEGEGENIYRATLSQSKGGFEWALDSTSGDFAVVSLKQGASKTSSATKVHLDRGNTWAASDGSTLITKVHSQMPAPEPTDASWKSFEVVKSSSRGLLANHKFVQYVFTHAGAAPRDPPRDRSATVRIKFHAECWLFR
jgi:outer membrane protein assembly factor BamB